MSTDDLKRWVRLGLWVVAYVGACALFIRLRDDSLFAAVLAVMAILGAARRLHETVRQALEGQTSFRGRAAWGGAVLVIGCVLFWWGSSRGADGWRFFGVAVLFLGAGLLVEQLRASGWFVARFAWPGAAAVVALAGIGALVLVRGGSLGLKLVAAGVLVAPIVLGLLSERLRASVQWWWAGAGAALAVVVVVIVLAQGADASYVLPITAGLLVLLVAVAARSNADIVVVIAMAAVVWTLTHRTAPLAENVRADQGESVIVAIGDSYISGEGADLFYEGTNDQSDQAKDCRRAPTAYAALLMAEDLPQELPNDLLFLACSGAKIDEVRDQLAELERQKAELDLEVDLVILSVGGNDSLFGTIGRVCLLPTDCTEVGAAWTANLADVATKLDALYDDVQVAADGAPVLVVPYPIPLNNTRCSYSALTSKEHRFLARFTEALDVVVAEQATAHGFNVVHTMPDALDGRRICDRADPAKSPDAGDAAVNFLAANSVLGTLEQSVSPINWFHNSLHPNAQGHELMRATVVQWLEEYDLDDVPGTSPLADRAAPPSAELGRECKGDTADDLQSCSWAWAGTSMGWFLIGGGLLFLLLTAGLFAVALVAVRAWRTLND